MISTSSVLNALFFYSLILLVVWLLRRFTGFVRVGGGPALLLAAFVGIMRLLLPFEMPIAYAIRSWTILGKPQRFLIDHPEIQKLLLVIWAVGAVIALSRDIYVFLRARKRSRHYREGDCEYAQEAAERLGIDCPVLVTPDVEIPYVAGLFRHVIYVPELDQSEKRVELILRHEAQHIRSHDAQIKFAFGLLSAVMWWNVITIVFRREIDRLLELRCDRKVIEPMDEWERYEYGEMIQEMAERVKSGKRAPALALDESAAVGKSGAEGSILKQRMKMILAKPGQRPGWQCIAVQCALVLLICASYLVIFQPASVPAIEEFQDDSRTYYDVNFDDFGIGEENHSTFILKRPDGRYELCINYEFSRYLTDDEVASDQYKDIYIFEKGMQE